MSEQISVLIKTQGKQEKVSPISPKATVADLKELVEKQLGHPADTLRFIYSGRRLDDNQVLQDVGIHDQSALNLLFQSPIPLRPRANSKDQSLKSLSETGKTWTVKNFIGGTVQLDDAKMHQGVNIEFCLETLVKIPNKVNHVLLNQSANMVIEFAGVISSLEVVNAKNILIKCNGTIGAVQIDLSDNVQFEISSKTPNLTHTKFISTSATQFTVVLSDLDMRFTMPTSYLSEQIASRLSHNSSENEDQPSSSEKEVWVIKSLGVEEMKKEGVVNLSLLDDSNAQDN